MLAFVLAQNYVKRGTRWLNRHAPNPGWWRNCLNGGHSRVRMAHDNAGILALAFEYEETMADQLGYVTDAMALRKLGFDRKPFKARRLGLATCYISGWHPFPRRYPDIVIDCDTLDKAWAAWLTNPPTDLAANYRHPTAIDRKFAASDFDIPEPGTTFRERFRRFASRWRVPRTLQTT